MHSRFEPEEADQLIAAPDTLETYLDTLCAPLKGTTQAEEVITIRAEMQSHLLALAAAYEELGNRPQEAMREALQKFGSAHEVGTALQKEHRTAVFSQEFIAAIGAIMGLSLTSLIGGLAAWTAIFELEQFYLARGIFQAASDPFSAGYVVAVILGIVAGGVVWLRNLPPLRSAVWAGVIAAAIVLSACVCAELHDWHTLPGYIPFAHNLKMVQGTALIAAAASVSVGASGVCSKLLRRLGRQPRAATWQKQ